MNRESRRQILDMVARGRLTVDEAERLLLALDSGRQYTDTPAQPQARAASHLRVLVTADNDDDDEKQTVDMRIPIAILKAGLHLPGILPSAVSSGINRALAEQGVGLDVRKLKHRDIDLLIQTLQHMEIDVSSADQRVLIYVE